jgi:hypothetical protein
MLFFIHFGEEARIYPEWATRHFGTTSMRYFLLSHLPLALFVLLVSWQASRRATPVDLWPFLALATQWALATVAVFHLGTTMVFREWSPGLGSGTVLLLPLTAYVTRRVVAGSWMTSARALLAGVAGVAGMSGLLATLWIDVQIL